MLSFVMSFPFLFGHAASRLCLSQAHVQQYGLLLHPLQPIMGQHMPMLGYVGQCWASSCWTKLGYVEPFWATLAPYWAHVEPSWATLGFVLAFVLDFCMSASFNFCPCKALQQAP